MRPGLTDPSAIAHLRNAAFYRHAAARAASLEARRDAIDRHGYFLSRARAMNLVRDAIRRPS